MKLKIYYLVLLLAVSCSHPTKKNKETNLDQQTNDTKMNHDLFKKKVVILPAKGLDESSNQINIQDFVQDGKSFIPVFTSIDKFDESTRGQLKNPKIEIDGVLLLSILHGDETLRINPSL
ncbi:MAG: SseB family protein [Chitinophagales bacterium]